MLRFILVSVLIVIGAYASLQGPFFALLFYLWNAYFRPESWEWTHTIVRLNLSFLIAAYLVVAVIVWRIRPRMNGKILTLLGFLTFSGVSMVWSQDVAVSWTAWRDFAQCLVITYVLIMLVDDVPKLRLVMLVIALSLGFEGAKQGWAQMVLNPGGQNPNRIVFLGDNNGAGLGMMMLAPFLIALAGTARWRSERFLHFFLLVGVLYRGLSTYSRGALIAAVTLAAISWLRASRKLAALLIGAVLIVPVSVLGDAYWQRMNTIAEGEESDDDSIQARLHLWKVGWEMARDNPLVGCGFAAFESCYDRYDFSQGEYSSRRAAHSSWFGILGDLGFVGFAFYCAVLAAALRACSLARRVGRTAGTAPELKPFADAIESSLIVFLVGGSFLSFQYNEMVWHLVGISFAMELVAKAYPRVAVADPIEASLERPAAPPMWRPAAARALR